MKKISIAMFSTFKQPGWKSEQLEKLVPLLDENKLFTHGYGIKTFKKVKSKNLSLSVIPLITMRVIEKLKFLGIKSYIAYLAGEFITGILFAKKIALDGSNIVYLKARPYSLIKKCKQQNKYIILEYGELHPIEMKVKVESEYSQYNVTKKYIFTSKYAIDQSLKSIDAADTIILLSEETKASFIRNGVNENKLKVIHLGLQDKYINSINEKNEFAFVSTATHSFVKGTHTLLLAWKELNFKNVKLYIVGDLSADVIEFIDNYGPFENVEFTGKKNIHQFYKNKNFVGVLNSLAEGYPRTVIEYMGYGFPVITTSVATCDIVKSGKNGFIVDCFDELKNALQYFYKNKFNYLQMSENARNSAESTLKNSFSDEVLKLIQGVE